MAWSFNVFTGNLDQTGSGAVVFEGEVETFADLPETQGDPAVGASYLVRTSTGVWLVNRRQAGIWIRKNNTGVRATDWEYGGDYPVNSVNGQTGNVTIAVPTASSATPAALGTAAAGTSSNFARADHVHAMPNASSLLSTGAGEGDLPVAQGDGSIAWQNGTTWVGQNINAGDIGAAAATHTHTASQITDFAQAAQDYTIVSTAQTLTVGAKVAADTTAGAFTLTLPATPSNGDTVSILDYAGTFDTNNLTIARNGSNIESLAENMDCNIEDAAFSLVYVGSTVGWKVVPLSGTAIAGVISNPAGVAGADAITNMMSLTQAEYNAIGSPDPTTLFIITDP